MLLEPVRAPAVSAAPSRLTPPCSSTMFASWCFPASSAASTSQVKARIPICHSPPPLQPILPLPSTNCNEDKLPKVGGGESHQSASTGVAALLYKSAENAAADKTRSAAPHIHPPRPAVNPPHLPPPPQHCWLRCWSGAGGPAPAPGPARACATAPSSSSVRSRRSGAPTTIFAKTGPEILIFRKSSCHQGCHRTRSQSST